MGLGGKVQKRLLDLGIGIAAYFALSPLLCLLSLIVFLGQGKPIFFRQERSGKDGKPFKIYKFRTMSDSRGENGQILPDEKRITLLGIFLRRISLDEFPELVNVLKGEMSIVGPRPLLMKYLDRYTPEQARRHQVKPGITGWAQVNGRNAITWEQKFEYDVWYVDHLSLRFDLKIIAITLWKILIMEGINQPGQATAQEFMGTHAKTLSEL